MSRQFHNAQQGLGDLEMYYYIKGELVALKEDYAAIDCGGVCYKLWISGTSYSYLAPLYGKKAQLYTYLNVREDVLELYGFATEEEGELFRMLISVSGVGPKAACSILTSLNVNGLVAAISAGDAKAISRAQGIGLKTAQKVILELGGKIAKTGIAPAADVGSAPVDSGAMDALLVLGYTRAEAAAALKGLGADLSLEEKIAEALKRLSII